jgi:hypothetical protein
MEISMQRYRWWTVLLIPCFTAARAEWKVSPPSDHRQPAPQQLPADAPVIKPGDNWPNDDKYRWLLGELEIPEAIDGKPVNGQAVGLQFNCGDGGEVHVNGELHARYDNDHPALVLLTGQARPGMKVRVAVQVYAKVQGGDKFDQAGLVLIDPQRAHERLALSVDVNRPDGAVPEGIIGLSQGGGLSDYEQDTSRKLREGGFKWFRMDNILTQVVKRDEQGQIVQDWADYDRRVDFIHQMGAEPIFAASYMPIPFDAVDNKDRQSAPRDYQLWEDLCYQAAKRALDRGKPVRYWEVWNEPNTGWIKPGPQDQGGEAMTQLYKQATQRDQVDHEVVRRFEAYAKLYRATARGVLRADPKAQVGGPALASGPFDDGKPGPGVNGKGFSRGLMLYCRQEKLPLDFLTWHEYFHPADAIAAQADAFREYLRDFPEFASAGKHLVITEWNEAWWPNRPMDHEMGAAWCAEGVVRTMVPKKARPCLFYVKQGDSGFRGDWSILMKDNVPKPTYHMAKIFNQLSGRWLPIKGTDEDVCGLASWDPAKGRLAIVLVNFRFRHAFRRFVRVSIPELPAELSGGRWREFIVDATHSNVWNDPNSADLHQGRSGNLTDGTFTYDATLMANSITLIELLAKEAG